MHDYKVHTLSSTPDLSKPALEGLQRAFGMIPNLAATMSESPVLIDAFVSSLMRFAGGTFSPGERQLILLTSAVANRCGWAVAFHSTAALREGVAAADVAAVRDGGVPAQARAAVLVATARALVIGRGVLERPARDAFEAQFTPPQLLEIIAGLGASMMANYAGNITQPPLDEPFRAQAW